MSKITVKLDPLLPNWHMDCGSEFHEALLSDLRVHRSKDNSPEAIHRAMFTGISLSERLTLGPWEVRAGPMLYQSLKQNQTSGWIFE